MEIPGRKGGQLPEDAGLNGETEGLNPDRYFDCQTGLLFSGLKKFYNFTFQ